MIFVGVVLVLVVVPGVVQGVQDKTSRENEPVEYDMDYGSNNFVLKQDEISTTAKPKHHIHPLEMASNLNYPELCKCFSKLEVSQECRQKYPDNLRTLRDGSIQMAYATNDKSAVGSKSLPLIVVSSGAARSLVLMNETLVLVCEQSLGAALESVGFQHISRLHMNGKILQDRMIPVHLTFKSISTPLRFPAGSLHLLHLAPPTAEKLTSTSVAQQNKNSTKKMPGCSPNSASTCVMLSLAFNGCTSVVFESNSVEVSELTLNAEYVDLLKLYPEAITLTSPRPILTFKMLYSRMLTIQTNAIVYANLKITTDVCGLLGQLHPVVEFSGIQKVSFSPNAFKLLPCTDLTLRNIYITHAGTTSLTNLPKSMLNRVVVSHVQGNGDLMPGAFCLLANTVKVAENQLFVHHLYEDEGDVIWVGGVQSVNVIEGAMAGVRTCKQQKMEVLGKQGCQICQVNKVSSSSIPPPVLLHGNVAITITTTTALPPSTASYTTNPPTQQEQIQAASFNLYENKMLLLYLVVAASIIVMAIIAALIIHTIRKRKKRMSWKVPSLPWAKSHYNMRHPALAAKAAYRASREHSGKPECYTIFDSIAAAQQAKVPPPPPPPTQHIKEKQTCEEKQDHQDCTYSEPVDSLASSRRDSNIYDNPSNIKGCEGSIDRSAYSGRRLSATTASVASSIANLSVISEMSTKDRRKSSYGLLIDITSALGIESNYKQLNNQ